MNDYVNADTATTETVITTEAAIEARERVAFRRGKDEANAEHQAWIERSVALAHQYADDNDLCSRFDEFMQELGLPGRQRDFNVDVCITFNVTVTARGATAEDAMNEVDSEDIAQAVREATRYSLPDWDAEHAELA
jgi:hypothetical protein